MAINDVLGLTLELSANTDKFVKDLRKAAGKVDLSFNPKHIIKDFTRAQSGINKLLSTTVADAATSGFSRASIVGLTKKMGAISNEIAASNKRIFEMNIEMGRKGIAEQEKLRLKGLRTEEKERLAGAEKRFSAERKSTDLLMDRRKKAMKEAAKTLKDAHLAGVTSAGKAAETFGSGIEKAFGNIKSGNFSDLIKSLGGAATAGGKKASEKVKGQQGSGALAGIGKILSKIGPALAAIGAVVAGIASLVAIVVSADSAMKDLNRTMMTAGVSGADLVNQYGMLGDTLTDISSHFAGSFSFNRLWGTTAKDHVEILGAFAGAGVTFREMKEGVKGAAQEMDRLRQFTVAALTYSKLLGLSTQEVSSTMASYMEELGLTLDGVRARFSNIVGAAKESGFATKRFFNMVLQATSGMSMYNVRLEEAAGLLLQLGSILGQKMGGDFLQNLMKGFKDEGTQDRIKKTMQVGVKLQSRVLQKDAVKSAEEFAKKLGDLSKKDSAQGGAIGGILSKYGVGQSGTDAKGFAKKLGQMSPKELGMLSAELKAQGSEGAGLGRSIVDMATKGKAFQGGRAGSQAARASAGGGAALFLQLNAVQKHLGKSLDQIDLSNEKQRLAFESLTGVSGEAAESLRRVGLDLRGQFNLAKKAQRGTAQDIADFNASKLAKKIGIQINEETRKFERVGEGGKTTKMGQRLEDFFLGFGDKMLGQEDKKVAEDILLAQEIASNTTDMSIILKQGIEWLLQKIYRSVSHIANIMGLGGLTDTEKMARGEAGEQLRNQIAATREEISGKSKFIAATKRGLKAGKFKGGDKVQAEEDLKAAQDRVAMLQGRGRIETAQLRASQRITETGGRFSPKTSTKFLAEAAQDKHVQSVSIEEYDRLKGGSLRGVGQAAGAKMREDLLAKARVDAAGRTSARKGTRMYGPGETAFNVSAGASDRMMADADIKKAKQAGAFWEDFTIGNAIKDAFNVTTSAGGIPLVPSDEQKRLDAAAQKKNSAEEQKQKKDQAKAIVEGFRDSLDKQNTIKLAEQLANLGVEGDAMDMAKGLRKGNVPKGLDLGERVFDPSTQTMRRRGDMLAGGGHAGIGGARAIRSKIGTEGFGAEPPANDFIMQVGTGGRIKFAQRINSADEVTAMATKPGGAVRGASSGKRGAGGSNVVINSFGNAAEVIRGIQAAVAAGVI